MKGEENRKEKEKKNKIQIQSSSMKIIRRNQFMVSKAKNPNQFFCNLVDIRKKFDYLCDHPIIDLYSG